MQPTAKSFTDLPLYKDIVPLIAETDAGLRLGKIKDFRFAARVNALPLAAVEFVPASRSYPIGFTLEPPHAPICFVGIEATQNLFIEDNGRWLAASYVPAYLRRYPFVMMRHKAGGESLLAVDRSSPFVGQEKGALLFHQGKPTPALEQALSFCADYDRQWTVSLAFCSALKGKGLLSVATDPVKLASGQSLELGSFLQIDEQALLDLDAETFMSWRDRGWLAPLYAAIASKHNWVPLAQMQSR